MSHLATEFAASFATPTEAVEFLAESLGKRHSLSRLGEWRNGRRPVPARVRLVMLNRTLEILLAAHCDIDPAYRDDLRESIIELAA